MKSLVKIFCLSLLAVMTGNTSLRAQWNTIQHDATTNRTINDICFVSSTGYAVGWHADNVSWGSRGLLYKTTDGGLSWDTTFLPLVIGTDSIVSLKGVQFLTPLKGYAVAACYTTNGVMGLYYGALIQTIDGGNNWTTNFSTKNLVNYSTGYTTDLNHVYFYDASSAILCGRQRTSSSNYNGITFYTFNGGNNWNSSVAYNSSQANASFFFSNGVGSSCGGKMMSLMGPYDGRIARSTNGGGGWNITYYDPSYAYVDIMFPTSQVGYAVGDSMYYTTAGSSKGKIVKTTDGGLTWSQAAIFSNFMPLTVFFTDALTGYVGGETAAGNSGILKTTDGGITWTPEAYPDIALNSYISSITFSTPNTGYASNGWSSSTSVYGNFLQSCGVSAGPDTTFCQQQGQLQAIPASPGNYTFNWSPATGLDNPNAQNPNVISGVSNQQYVVTMTDTANNCSATDTVIVSAYYWSIDTLYSCNNQPVTIDLGPGATQYTYQFTDTAGNPHSGILPSQYYVATQPAQYIFIGFFPNCGALTSLITVIDSCNVSATNVWPGDCNYDLTANMADALHIGLAYNASGATRPNASPLWYPQPMNDWSQNFANCNYKHADADGNGIVNVNDTLPIALNYGNTHPFRLGAPQQVASAPELYLVANYDTVGLQTLVTVDIRLGSASLPVDSIYGISFRLSTDAALIDTNMTGVNLGTTWLGTPGGNMFHFRKNFASSGIMDIAECGTDHLNRTNGNGSIGSFLIVTTDNLSGIAVCHFNLSDITAVTIGQQYLVLNTVNDSVVIDPSVPTGITPEPAAVQFSCYPNPASENVQIRARTTVARIEVCDMTGRVVLSESPAAASATISTSALAEGIYLVRVYAGTTVSTQKLTISHQ